MKGLSIIICYLAVLLVVNIGFAQPYVLTIQNETFIAGSGGTPKDTVQFDVYLRNTGTPSGMYLSNCDFRVNFNSSYFTSPSIVYVAGTSTVSKDGGYTYGVTAAIPSTGIISITLVGIIPADITDFGTNVGPISTTGNGTCIGRFKLRNVTDRTGTAGLRWRSPSAGPYPTIITAYDTTNITTTYTLGGTLTEPNDLTFTHLSLSVKTFLQGPYNTSTGLMNTTLRSSGLLASHFSGIPIPFNTVDSINIEIRNAASASASTIRKFAPAWLLADGTIRSFTDTTKSFVEFDTAAGNYYVVVRHRNHLAIMSAAPIGLSSAGSNYNFTTAQTQAYGISPMKSISGIFSMYTGDADRDGQIISLDFSLWLPVAKRAAIGYESTDFNLDAQVTTMDFSFWLPNAKSAAMCQIP
jgi:hypothetical protein